MIARSFALWGRERFDCSLSSGELLPPPATVGELEDGDWDLFRLRSGRSRMMGLPSSASDAMGLYETWVRPGQVNQ